MEATAALRDFVHDKTGRAEGARFSRKRSTAQLGLQHRHQARSRERGLKAKGFTQRRETSKDTNPSPDSSSAATPCYRKVNSRHVSTEIDSRLIDSQEETPTPAAGTPRGTAPELCSEPSSSRPLVAGRRTRVLSGTEGLHVLAGHCSPRLPGPRAGRRAAPGISWEVQVLKQPVPPLLCWLALNRWAFSAHTGPFRLLPGGPAAKLYVSALWSSQALGNEDQDSVITF